MAELIPAVSNVAQNLYEASSIRQHNLGDRVFSTDGRKFVYIKAGGVDLVAGTLQQGPLPISDHANLSVASDSSAGSNLLTVTLSSTAVTLDQYRYGFALVNAGTGKGYIYSIIHHPAVSSSGTLTLILEDQLQAAVSSSGSKVTLFLNPYKDVIQCPSTLTNTILGLCNKAIPAGYFGWLQTHGPSSALLRGTSGGSPVGAAAGQNVIASANTVGTLEPIQASNAGPAVGFAMAAGTSSATPQATGVFLTLD